MLAVFLSLSLDVTPTQDWWVLLFIMVANLLFIVAITLPFAWCVALIPDVSQLLPIITMGLMLTRAYWDVNEIPDVEMREVLPLTNRHPFFVLDAYRAVILRGQLPDLHHLSILAVLCLGLPVPGHTLYSKTRYLLVRRVLNS